jgi:DNA-binding Xre family transcriptional regulator/signal peptidase I
VVILSTFVLPYVEMPAKGLTYSGSSSYKSGKYYSQLTNIALTSDQRKDIVDIAQSQIGYQEGGSSSHMWCAMFVSWCAHVAGVPTSVVPNHSYTPTGLQWFRDRGLAYSRSTVANGGYTPQPGDIIYFKSSRNENITNHVGIVTGYSNGTVYTVEGNTSSAMVSTNGGAVCAKSYSISNTYIVYICSPKYTKPAVEETPPIDPWRDVVFDAAYYAAKYSDAKASCGTDAGKLFDHYKKYGVPEGRQASPNFDLKYYLANNPSVQQIIGSATNYPAAYDYYLSSGYLETALTAQHLNVGDHFYARLQMTPGKNLSLNDTNVILYSASELPAQIWEFIHQSDGTYKIVNAKYGLCLSVQDKARHSGANEVIAKDTGDLSQRWYIYEDFGRYVFRLANSAYCLLEVYGGKTEDLTNVEIYAASRSIAQTFDILKFDYTGAEYAVDLGQDIYVKISNIAAGTFLTNASVNVTCGPDADSATVVWRMIHQDDGSYRIIGQNTRLDMMAQDGADGNGVNVNMQYDYDAGLAAQRWYIYRCHNGYTQNGLAERAGVSQTHLRRVELGEADITVGHLQLLCDAMNVSLKEFFAEDADKDKISAAFSNLSPKQKKLLIAFLESL